MAGNYPDVPANRIPYDRDGTVVISRNSALAQTQLSSTEILTLNDEDNATNYVIDSGVFTSGQGMIVMFPRLMDISGFMICKPRANVTNGCVDPFGFETSVNTTNGVDGTWVAQSAVGLATGPNIPGYRTTIGSTAYTAIRAIRWSYSNGGSTRSEVSMLHIYGKPSTGENDDRLELWHPTLDQRVGAAYFDEGNVPRGSTADLPFRLKNRSSTYTANTITVSIEAATDTSPSVPGQHTFSNGGSYAATTSVSSIAPGAISGTLTLRRITPTNAVLSVWVARIKAVPASWT